MAALLGTLSRYSLVGVANTLITLAVIYFLQQVLGLGAFTANIFGYAAGLLNSFVLNGKLTFRTDTSVARLKPFLLSFVVAYGLNLTAIQASAPLASVHFMMPHLVGIAVYNVAFFLLLRLWVFRSDVR